MANNNLVSDLAVARRRAQAAGRPLSTRETESIAKGFSAQDRGLALQAKSLKQQQSQFAEQLALQRKEQDALIEAGKGSVGGAVAKTGTGVLAGAYAGGQIGAAGGPIGAVGGAIIGGIAGLASEAGKGCMIVTACTHPDSYEVGVTRAYRNHMLGPITKAGYYVIAPLIANMVKKYRPVKFLVKKLIVDRLVDYGEYTMGWKDNLKYKSSKYTTATFLGMCRALGEFKLKTEGIREEANG